MATPKKQAKTQRKRSPVKADPAPKKRTRNAVKAEPTSTVKRVESEEPPPIQAEVVEAKGLGDLLKKSPGFKVTVEDIDDRVDASGDTDVGWNAVQQQFVDASPLFLAQEILTGPPEFPYKGRFLVGDHHIEWEQLVLNYDRICVEAPRDHGKTFFFDYAVPLWKICTIPNGSGFIFSATQEQAIRILDDIKTEIETNPKLQWLIPAKKERWSSTSIRLSNGHTVYARGFGTKVRGAHPHWIIVDDGLNDETIYSETVRAKQIDYFYSAITNMCIPGGQIIVVGTPFHQSDLYADLSENPEYVFKRYRALDEAEEVALWPERYDVERLLRKKKEIGSIRFTREFLCEPIADDMSLFPRHLFAGDPTEQFNVCLGMPKKYWDDLGVTIFMGVDFALSSNVSADWTVIWLMGIDRFKNRWIVDIVRGKGMPYQQQLSKINELGRLYDPALVFLEANQAQRIFGDELIRTTDLPIKLFTTGVQKNTLDKGVPSLRVLFENGKMRIPRGDKRSVELTNLWKEEMRAFTWHEGKLQSVGTHDDTVMAFWICDQAIRQGGFSFDFGEDVDETQSLDDYLLAENAEENEMADIVDILVETANPKGLDAVLKDLKGGLWRVVGIEDSGGAIEVDGYHVVRVLQGDPKFLMWALTNQGYAKVIGIRGSNGSNGNGSGESEPEIPSMIPEESGTGNLIDDDDPLQVLGGGAPSPSEIGQWY